MTQLACERCYYGPRARLYLRTQCLYIQVNGTFYKEKFHYIINPHCILFQLLTNFMITYDTQQGGNETSFTIGINNNDEYAGSDNVSLYLLESDFENIIIAPNYD